MKFYLVIQKKKYMINKWGLESHNFMIIIKVDHSQVKKAVMMRIMKQLDLIEGQSLFLSKRKDRLMIMIIKQVKIFGMTHIMKSRKDQVKEMNLQNRFGMNLMIILNSITKIMKPEMILEVMIIKMTLKLNLWMLSREDLL